MNTAAMTSWKLRRKFPKPVDIVHSRCHSEGMTKNECILNHADPRFGGVSRCGQVATYLVQYKGCPALPACSEMAQEAIEEGATVVHVDALYHAGIISQEEWEAIRTAFLAA